MKNNKILEAKIELEWENIFNPNWDNIPSIIKSKIELINNFYTKSTTYSIWRKQIKELIELYPSLFEKTDISDYINKFLNKTLLATINEIKLEIWKSKQYLLETNNDLIKELFNLSKITLENKNNILDFLNVIDLDNELWSSFDCTINDEIHKYHSKLQYDQLATLKKIEDEISILNNKIKNIIIDKLIKKMVETLEWKVQSLKESEKLFCDEFDNKIWLKYLECINRLIKNNNIIEQDELLKQIIEKNKNNIKNTALNSIKDLFFYERFNKNKYIRILDFSLGLNSINIHLGDKIFQLLAEAVSIVKEENNEELNKYYENLFNIRKKINLYEILNESNNCKTLVSKLIISRQLKEPIRNIQNAINTKLINDKYYWDNLFKYIKINLTNSLIFSDIEFIIKMWLDLTNKANHFHTLEQDLNNFNVNWIIIKMNLNNNSINIKKIDLNNIDLIKNWFLKDNRNYNRYTESYLGFGHKLTNCETCIKEMYCEELEKTLEGLKKISRFCSSLNFGFKIEIWNYIFLYFFNLIDEEDFFELLNMDKNLNFSHLIKSNIDFEEWKKYKNKHNIKNPK